MKRSILTLFCLSLFLVVVSSHAQTAPSATKSTFSLSAGGMGSVFHPDIWYDASGNPNSGDSPNRLYGVGAYVDVHFNRWAQIEAEGRWLRFNQYKATSSSIGNNESNYEIGPRIAPYTFHRFTPYGKVLVGMGEGDFLQTGRWLSKRFTLRAFDFEYQRWRVVPTLYPYGGSVGLSYKIF
jgi:hypothetical protein